MAELEILWIHWQILHHLVPKACCSNFSIVYNCMITIIVWSARTKMLNRKWCSWQKDLDDPKKIPLLVAVSIQRNCRDVPSSWWDLPWAYHAHLSPSLLCTWVRFSPTLTLHPSSSTTFHTAVEGEAFLKIGFLPCSLWPIITHRTH